MISSEEQLVSISALLAEGSDRSTSGGFNKTATGAALRHAAVLLAEVHTCQAHTVDLSSDGMSNNGPAPQDIYSASLLHGINVNALVIVQTGRDDGAPAERSQYRQYRRLVGWFDREVLHGPHAFSIVADGFDDFERAICERSYCVSSNSLL
jgi:hypothetical protein